MTNDPWVKQTSLEPAVGWGEPPKPTADPWATPPAKQWENQPVSASGVPMSPDNVFAGDTAADSAGWGAPVQTPHAPGGSWDTQNPATAQPDAPVDPWGGRKDWSAPDINGDEWPQATPPGWGKDDSVVDADDAFKASGWGAAAGFQDPDEKQRQADEAYAQREAQWRDERIMGAEERTRALNAINQQRGQEWTVNQDGELDRLEKPERGQATGIYIAYQKPNSLLHAILSGPYPDQRAASLWADAAYDLMTQDPAFNVAFDKVFVREGVYYVELESRRKGAYGVLS